MSFGGVAAVQRPDGRRGSALGSRAGEPTWRCHPIVARNLQLLAFFGPVLAATVVGMVAIRLVPVPEPLGLRAAWWFAVTGAITVVLVTAAAVLRRLLPLAALLRMPLAFPDEAPSRFLVARRAGFGRGFGGPTDDRPGAQAAVERCLTMVVALGDHDRLTRGHSQRVRAYCDVIGEELRLSDADRDKLRWAGLLHDIGKVGVSTDVLNKRGRLTADEWDELREHPAIGARLTEPLEPWLGDWVRAVGEHHERVDGRGYPAGLVGDEISLAARIVAVADAFDVMTAARSYTPPVSAVAARAELVRCSGTQFDEEVVRAFLAVSVHRIRRIIGPSALLAQIPLLGPVLLHPAGAGAAPVVASALVVGGLTAPTALVIDGDVEVRAGGATAADDPAHGGPGPGDPSAPVDVEVDVPGPVPPPAPVEAPPVAPEEVVAPVPPVSPTIVPVVDGVVRPVVDEVVDGAVVPVVEPVVSGVVDPLVDVVDGTLPGTGGLVDETTCALLGIGCP